jgi:hypothetical protein
VYKTTASSIHGVPGITGKLRNNTAPGEGSITTELVEGGGRRLWKNTHIVMESVLEEKQRAEQWDSVITCPVYSSGIVSSHAQYIAVG